MVFKSFPIFSFIFIHKGYCKTETSEFAKKALPRDTPLIWACINTILRPLCLSVYSTTIWRTNLKDFDENWKRAGEAMGENSKFGLF